jgi:hypothetical protein
VNLLGDSVDTIKRKTETLIDASNEVGLEVTAHRTKHILLSHHKNAGKYRDIKIASRSFENVAQFKCLGTTVTNQNLNKEEIRKRLKSGIACYISVQNLLSSRLLSKNVKIGIYKTIILPVVLYGCETWSLILREKHRPRVVENRALRGIFGGSRGEVTGGCRGLHNEKLHDLYPSPSVIGMMKSRRMRFTGHVTKH